MIAYLLIRKVSIDTINSIFCHKSICFTINWLDRIYCLRTLTSVMEENGVVEYFNKKDGYKVTHIDNIT